MPPLLSVAAVTLALGALTTVAALMFLLQVPAVSDIMTWLTAITATSSLTFRENVVLWSSA